MRTARWNRFRQKHGLMPLPRAGQAWEVEYFGWNSIKKVPHYRLITEAP